MMDYTRPKKDSIVRAVVEQMGHVFDTLPISQYAEDVDPDDQEESDVNIVGNPSLHIYPDGTTIIRWTRDGIRIRYDLDDKGGILTIEEMQTPDTILTALAGEPLDVIVKVPGGDAKRIVCVVNSKAFVSDPLDTRIQVEDMK